jgi:hydroxymethylbilane synthase
VPSARRFIVGTRGSRLALHQTEIVTAALRTRFPDLLIDVREMRTEGDRRPDVSLASIGGQGVFVKELEAALVRNEIDFAVHSLKDVPAEVAEGLVLAAYPERAAARDALVTRGEPLSGLPAGARIGTGSQRRAVQLRSMRSDIEPVDIRGNVDTRVRKVDDGTVDGAVLALAGLERLGLGERAVEVFEPDVMIPAVGQGALAVEARADDGDMVEALGAIDDRVTRQAVEAERAFLERLGGGCRLPFGALATVDGDALLISGFISDESGASAFRSEMRGPASDAGAIGVRLAEALLAQGAARFIEAGT